MKSAIRIVRSLGDETSRLPHGLRAAARLHERQHQVVGGFREARPRRSRLLEGLHRRIERAHPDERFPKPVLHLGVPRRRARRLPQQRQRRRVVAAGLERHRARVGLPGTAHILRGRA